MVPSVRDPREAFGLLDDFLEQATGAQTGAHTL